MAECARTPQESQRVIACGLTRAQAERQRLTTGQVWWRYARFQQFGPGGLRSRVVRLEPWACGPPLHSGAWGKMRKGTQYVNTGTCCWLGWRQYVPSIQRLPHLAGTERVPARDHGRIELLRTVGPRSPCQVVACAHRCLPSVESARNAVQACASRCRRGRNSLRHPSRNHRNHPSVRLVLP